MSRLAANTVQVAFTVLLAAAALVAHGGALAADPTPGAQPRIGLALSGGGARGIAHVGVLKVLEEMRIPIHCVTGTSMGSIVGGAFAAGTPPSKLEEIVLAANWNEIFRDQPPRDEISMRRKADDYKTLFAPEFGVKDGGLALPKGRDRRRLDRGVLPRAGASRRVGIDDFRKLPIPFRAMATDIETGESVVLDRGSVAQAMRASMAVPGAIAPVEIDGRLLVDGGIANNLPIDEARKLCARRGDRRQHLHAAAEARRAHVRAFGRRPAHQLPRQADGRPAAEEHGQRRRADRARPGRHLRRQLRARQRRHPHRRGGDADDGGVALALQRPARAVCGAARDAGRSTQVARHRRRDPLRGTGAHQSRGAARAGGEQARRAADRGEDQRRPAPHLRPRRLRERRLPHRRRKRRPARDGDHAAREVVGAGLPALRPRPRQRLPGRQRLQRARPVSQDLAQPAGRRVADRGPGRAGHASVHRVLPAAARARRLVRLARTARSGRCRAACSAATTRSRST